MQQSNTNRGGNLVAGRRDGKFFVYDRSEQRNAGIYVYEIATGTERRLIGA